MAIAAEILDSEVEIDGLCYLEMGQYLAINLTPEEAGARGISHLLPTRLTKTGRKSRLTIKASQIMGPHMPNIK